MVNLDELRERLATKDERLKILDEINDGAYLSSGEDDRDLSKKSLTKEGFLLERIQYLGTLLHLCFERIDILEEEK